MVIQILLVFQCNSDVIMSSLMFGSSCCPSQERKKNKINLRASCQNITEPTIRSACGQRRSQAVRCWWPLILRVSVCLSAWCLTNTETWRCWKEMCPWLYRQDIDRLQVPVDTSIQPVTALLQTPQMQQMGTAHTSSIFGSERVLSFLI